MKTVADLRTNVEAILTGVDLDDVPDLYGSFERAVSTLIQKADILEASGREPITLYDRVFDYLAPTNIFGGALIDIRPQAVDTNGWNLDVQKMPIKRFNQTKWITPSGYTVTFEFDPQSGMLIMRVAQNTTTQALTVADMGQDDDWTVGGTISNLTTDSTNFYTSPGSLRFLLSTGVGTLTTTLSQALDITQYEDVGVAFLAIQIPQGTDPTDLTSISLSLGSSALNYDMVTETEGFLGAWVAGEWLLVAFDFASAVSTGTPDWGAIDYVALDLTASANIVNMRLGALWIALPTPNQVLYYSPAIFKTSASATPSVEISSDNDLITLRPASYNIYVQEAAREVAKNEGGDISSGLIAGIDLVLEGNGEKKLGLYQGYRGDNPSEELRQVGSYYDSPGPGAYGGTSGD